MNVFRLEEYVPIVWIMPKCIQVRGVCSGCLDNADEFSGSAKEVVDYCDTELLGKYPVKT